MSTTTKVPHQIGKASVAAPLPRWHDAGAQHCVLEGVSWDTYERLLKEADNGRIFLTYHHGTLEIMSPSARHERQKSLAARLLELYALEANVPIESYGMMTMKRRKLACGLEPDECYYVANAERARDIHEWRESTIAPDLAIEVEVSRRLASRREIYAALGVKELWVEDGSTLRVFVLRSGAYEQAERSINFPHLPLRDFERFLRMRGKRSEHDILREFQKWVRARTHRSQQS